MENTTFFSSISKKDTLSYKCIYEEKNLELDLRGINIIGCKIESSIFETCNFKSSDFNGTVINDCSFINCDLSRSDICSVIAHNTVFKDIDFCLSTMRNCKFSNCKFIKCRFNHIALSNTSFNNCSFNNIRINQSSTYLNVFSECIINNCKIKGNFFYNLLINNELLNCSWDHKLYAYNHIYGSKDDSFSIDLRKEQLVNYLISNELLINLVILDLNEKKDIDLAIIRFIKAIEKMLANRILIHDEQLEFIFNIIVNAIDYNLLSIITIAECIVLIDKIYEKSLSYTDDLFYKSKGHLDLIKYRLHQEYEKLGQEISNMKSAVDNKQEHIVNIIYEEEPNISLCEILNQIKISLNISCPDAIRIKTAKGSFIEWISCYGPIIECLQLFIAVIGLGYKIHTDHPALSPDDNDHEDSKEISTENMIDLLKKALNKQTMNPEVSQTITIAVKNEIIASKKFRGYSKANVRSISIVSKKKD